MPTRKIMLIRHAENPTAAPNSEPGVMSDGRPNNEALTATGWKRADALVAFFDPPLGLFKSPEVVKPQRPFASAPSAADESLRPVQTLTPLSQAFGLGIDKSFSKEGEKALVKAVKAIGGVVLIAWQHERIPEIAGQISGEDGQCPTKWDPSRFDQVWVFDRQGDDDSWSFVQVPQLRCRVTPPTQFPWTDSQPDRIPCGQSSTCRSSLSETSMPRGETDAQPPKVRAPAMSTWREAITAA